MESLNRRATILGFLVTAAILTVLFLFVGVDSLVRELQKAELRFVGVVILCALGWMFAWGLSLRTVLGGLGHPVSPLRGFLLYAGAAFANNVTPFGQAGGEPVAALIFTRATDTTYERGLAAIASVDALNFVPSTVFIISGVAYYATEVTLGRNIFLATGFVVAMSLALPTILYLVWENRTKVETWVSGVLTPPVQWVSTRLPNQSAPSEDIIRTRVETFFSSVERIGSDPKRIGLAVFFSACGWTLQSVALWFGLLSVGITMPFSAALFIVPIGGIAGATPLPGGTGGIEPVLIGLVVTVSGAALANATAAIVIFRGAVYWMPIVIGGTFAAVETVLAK